MKILFLGYLDSPIIDFLKKDNQVIVYDKKITPSFMLDNEIEFVVSYGYSHIIKQNVLDILPGKIINLHISYLPFNRCADPNFWSFIEDTPKGVTIHLIDKGIDTGNILVQELVLLSEQDSLRKTYQILQDAIQKMFIANWENITNGKIKSIKQSNTHTFHLSTEKQQYIHEIKDWLDIPITDLIEHVGEIQMSNDLINK